MRIFAIFLILLGFAAAPPRAQTAECAATDTACLLGQLEQMTAAIDDKKWRDQTYRELAKLLTMEKQSGKAVDLLARIENPDTRAMTIRAIGIEAAKGGLTKPEYDALFARLTEESLKITHEPSRDIAMNYVADAQALSGDDAASMKTALSIQNAELRNKALYDSSKYQAERGAMDAAMGSIAAIDSTGFRDKGYRAVSKIFADGKKYEEAQTAAAAIGNAYQKAQAVLYILARQISPEEVSLVE